MYISLSMASPHHHPTSKPSKSLAIIIPFSFKNNNLYSLAPILFLCIFSYLFGLWQQSRGFAPSTATTNTISIPCNTAKSITTTTTKQEELLHFGAHHTAENGGTTVASEVKIYPPCNGNFSEYTPCEDTQRSLRFSRHNLIYREKHCSEKDEKIKCRIPAPYGYKDPFTWPASRNFAWYSNVPHKHLTVEKAVQNWIRYEGDRFRFPRGGTMFPNGADAYIDDIGRLINLKSGSIRTAIDTGCGLSFMILQFPYHNSVLSIKKCRKV